MTVREILLERRYATVGGGALLAGVVAGLVGAVANSGVAIAVGLALASPLLFVHAHEIDSDAYVAREWTAVVLDVLVTIAVAGIIGVGGVLAVEAVLTGASWALVAVGAGGAAGGGSTAFWWRTNGLQT
ncbi:hypothetical protein [Halorhabdus salina]|uniref:hypothetical protein n=1 Tax=Halorhabdus salina TaxID=2750670 RepID=UPI0015EE8D06|nr:hypothetical protein [Halorhabdus salina]